MKKRHSEEQIIRILREAELHAVPIRDLCKQHNISEQTFYRWRDKYGGMEVADARRLKELESENAKLTRAQLFRDRELVDGRPGAVGCGALPVRDGARQEIPKGSDRVMNAGAARIPWSASWWLIGSQTL